MAAPVGRERPAPVGGGLRRVAGDPEAGRHYLCPVLRRVRYFISDVLYWVRGHLGRAALALVVLAGLAVGVVAGVSALSEDEPEPVPAPSPQVFVGTANPPEEPAELGFPAFATSNTTRVAGPDPVADAAGISLATFPPGGGEGAAAVTLVDAEDWAEGVAAAALVAEPIGAPILLTEGEELPELTASALESLKPEGTPASGSTQVFSVGGSPEPDGLKARAIDGANAAEVAAEIAATREELTGEPPEHVLIASSDEPAYAMPAAAWAARSGDPVLFAQADSVPAATIEALEGLADVPVYILGPEDVISGSAEKEIAEAAGSEVKRASTADDPVANSVEFARYVDESFGWNINDPGHGFVIANSTRPADAAAAAPLSGSGTWGPLLLTDDPESPSPALEGYLLDLKPGYEDDPTRALYNHIWIVGDESAVSVDFQVELDQIAEVARIRSGSGDSLLGPDPVSPEPEGDDRKGAKDEPQDSQAP